MTKPSKWTVQPGKTDQPEYQPVRSYFFYSALNGEVHGFFMQTTKTQIRLGICRVWSESLLNMEEILLVLTYPGSIISELYYLFVAPIIKTFFFAPIPSISVRIWLITLSAAPPVIANTTWCESISVQCNQFFPKSSPHFKKDIIAENHCHLRSRPFKL